MGKSCLKVSPTCLHVPILRQTHFGQQKGVKTVAEFPQMFAPIGIVAESRRVPFEKLITSVMEETFRRQVQGTTKTFFPFPPQNAMKPRGITIKTH